MAAVLAGIQGLRREAGPASVRPAAGGFSA